MAGSGTAHLRPSADTLLRAENLVVEFPVGKTGLKVHAVSDVSIDVKEGETLGLVGESGCGKSTTGRALMQLPRPTHGDVMYHGTDLTELSGPDLRRVRPEMQMIFQDPISSLNPRRRVGDIVAEPLRIWASEKHPPTATIKLAFQAMYGAAFVRFAFFVAIMLFWLVNSGLRGLFGYSFEILPSVDSWLKTGATSIFFSAILLGAAETAIAPLIRDRVPRARIAAPIASVAAIVLTVLLFIANGSSSSTVAAGIAAALSTIATLMMLASMGEFVAMKAVRDEHREIVWKTLSDVGIDPENAVNRRPHQFSGGQCQRICIARALVLDPKLIICDEPVSALDVSVQAQILNLLEDMKKRYGLTLVFIAHDLAVVKNVSDRVAVMYLGKLCEVAPPDELYANPAHPYTAALLGSIPVPDPTFRPTEENVLGGEIPSPVAPPSGCRFRTRCPRAQDMCAQVEPKMRQIDLGHYVACHFPLEVSAKKQVQQGQRR